MPQPVIAHPETRPATMAKPELLGNKLRTMAQDNTEPMLNKIDPYTLHTRISISDEFVFHTPNNRRRTLLPVHDAHFQRSFAEMRASGNKQS